jgi:hypothetical protein
MSLQLNIDYPENLPDAIGVPREQFEQEARWAMAIKLFEMKEDPKSDRSLSRIYSDS